MLEILDKSKKIKELDNKIEKLNQELERKYKEKLQYISEVQELLISKENLENTIDELRKEEIVNKEKNNKLLEKLRKSETYFIESHLDAIDAMSGLKFENFMGDILNKLGYDVKITKASGDNGADIIARDGEKEYAIQCKRYSTNVGFDAVKEVHAAKDIYECDVGVVLTNAGNFTKEAIENAKKLNILLWDRRELKRMLAQAYEIDITNLENGQYVFYNKLDKEVYDELGEEFEDDTDPFLSEAIETVIEIGTASASLIQRKFKVGYARATKIINQMEARGIISEYQESKPREVLISKESWAESKMNVDNEW